ncbi:hypothetical protein [Streptomyces griseorubiginosus]|uniref:hypothetical protein n=1 Tax=Streptomyces griseorubiginosus TaxID=67304 RepID=UPI002E8153BC|nr:hypothetical protein [Streptomyces griseorubiginosus]WUB46825.1 DUF3592 domain-containing protein [Streptomyces griseorubiginosus]WUB55347.1 DUF3592 domain-containing protein [Streptomyces griseorubiginosus]
MIALLYAVPALIMAAALFGAYHVVRRWNRARSAWRSGLTAEAECLRVYPVAHGGGDSFVRTGLRHVYEFRTREGRVVRFEEEGGPGTTMEGDIVTVHYADGPEVVATAIPHLRRSGHGLAAFMALSFIGVIVLFCAGFMVALTVFTSALHI